MDRQTPPSTWTPPTIRFFRQLWSALHTRALVIAPGTNDLAWLEQFSSLVPCGSCRNHWKQMMLTTPPTWHDYFGWTVARHNDVNSTLGKPLWDVEAARKKWRGGA